MNSYSGKGSIESSPQHKRNHGGGGQSDNSQEANNEGEIGEDDRRPPTLQVVAVRYPHHHHHSNSNTDDNRSFSSHKSESGYHSSGALSDGGGGHLTGVAAYTATSSIRSASSIGSCGSGGRSQEHHNHHHHHNHQHNNNFYNNVETRYSLVASNSYAASETAKSDIATVCSGSVTEDIEISSIDGTPIVPSPHSERVVMVGGGGNMRSRSVEFAPLTAAAPSALFHKQYSAAAVQQDRHATSPLTAAAHQAVADCDAAAFTMNDMGPPLSRALLMQSLQQSTTGSRAGSVKSFGSTGASQTSDVVAYVDTDDCGGSLMESVTDGQSIHSQEDVCRAEEDAEPICCEHNENGVHRHHDAQEKGDDEPMNGGTHPFLKNGSSGEYSNGRTSPGGTIYKGKGVRRYQGRYMNLPLKRFQQENAGAALLDTVLEADKLMENKRRAAEAAIPERGYDYEGDWRRRSESPPRGRNNGGYKNGHHSPERRYRGRGRSPTSPSRNNGYHSNNHSGEKMNGYHHHKNGNNNNGSNGYHHKNGNNGYHSNGNGVNNNHSNGYHKSGNGVKNKTHTNSYHNSGGNGEKNNHTNGYHKNQNGVKNHANNSNHNNHNGNHCGSSNNNGYSSSRRNRSRSRSRSNSPAETRRRRRRRNHSSRRNRNNSSSPNDHQSPRRRRRQNSQSGRSRS